MPITGSQLGVTYMAPQGQGLSQDLSNPLLEQMVLQKQKSKSDQKVLQRQNLNAAATKLRNYDPEYDIEDNPVIAREMQVMMDMGSDYLAKEIDPFLNPNAADFQKQFAYVNQLIKASAFRKEEKTKWRDNIAKDGEEYYSPFDLETLQKSFSEPIDKYLTENKKIPKVNMRSPISSSSVYWGNIWKGVENFQGTDNEVVEFVTTVLSNGTDAQKLKDMYSSTWNVLGSGERAEGSKYSEAQLQVMKDAEDHGWDYLHELAYQDAKIHAPKVDPENITYPQDNILERTNKWLDMIEGTTDMDTAITKLKTAIVIELKSNKKFLDQYAPDKPELDDAARVGIATDKLVKELKPLIEKNVAIKNGGGRLGQATEGERKQAELTKFSTQFANDLIYGTSGQRQRLLGYLFRTSAGNFRIEDATIRNNKLYLSESLTTSIFGDSKINVEDYREIPLNASGYEALRQIYARAYDVNKNHYEPLNLKNPFTENQKGGLGGLNQPGG